MPPYFKQEYRAACGLACLRMVLAGYGLQVSEDELLKRVEPDYGKRFSNIWNPTLAKLACGYGIRTSMYALWPLFKNDYLRQAAIEYSHDPERFDIAKYENQKDQDELTQESLTLAYKEMFRAIELGCRVVYGRITPRRMSQFLAKRRLILTSIRLKDMYPDKKLRGYHVILVYKAEGKSVIYHDPYHGSALECDFSHLQKAMTDVGAALVFSGRG